MPFDVTEYTWDCPCCGRTFSNTGDGKEDYIGHLEVHLAERDSVVVVRHEASGVLLGVFEDREAFDTWLDNEYTDWERHDVDATRCKVKT